MEMFGARPTYFVVRPDGTRIALVEVDQLPDWIQIAGISANLPAIDAYNNNMTCAGISERAPFQYIIDIIAAAAPNNCPSSSTTSTAKNNPPTTSSDAQKKEQPPPTPPPKQQQQLVVVVAGNGEDNREPRNGLSRNNKAQVSESRCR